MLTLQSCWKNDERLNHKYECITVLVRYRPCHVVNIFHIELRITRLGIFPFPSMPLVPDVPAFLRLKVLRFSLRTSKRLSRIGRGRFVFFFQRWSGLPWLQNRYYFLRRPGISLCIREEFIFFFFSDFKECRYRKFSVDTSKNRAPEIQARPDLTYKDTVYAQSCTKINNYRWRYGQ